MCKAKVCDLGFVGFAQLRDPFFPPGTIDDITFLITLNNYIAEEVNTVLCMVIGYDFKISLIQV